MWLPTAKPVAPPATPPIAAPAKGAPTAAPTSAPPAAPTPVPIKVPFSRVDSGSPEQAASEVAMATAPTTVVNVLLSFIAIGTLHHRCHQIIRAKTEESSCDRERW